MDIDWNEEVVLDMIQPYLNEEPKIEWGSYRNYPNIYNGLLFLKTTWVDPELPRAFTIQGRTIQVRLPGEPIRDHRCYGCGLLWHNKRDCPGTQKGNGAPWQTPTYAKAVTSPKSQHTQNTPPPQSPNRPHQPTIGDFLASASHVTPAKKNTENASPQYPPNNEFSNNHTRAPPTKPISGKYPPRPHHP